MGNNKKFHTNSGKRKQEHISPLFTCDEVCERLRITRRTFFAWVKKGYLPAMKMGGQWRVEPNELTAFIDSTRNHARTAA